MCILHTATYTVTYHASINTNRVHIFITVFTTGVLISSYLDPGRKQATATETYNTIPGLIAYKQQQYIAVVCTT